MFIKSFTVECWQNGKYSETPFLHHKLTNNNSTHSLCSLIHEQSISMDTEEAMINKLKVSLLVSSVYVK